MELIYKACNYSDISIVPRHVSEIESRSCVNTSVKFCNTELRLPIIGSPMPDVCDSDMCHELFKNGCFGFLHRFQDINSQLKEYKKHHFTQLGCAIGVNGDYLDRFKILYDNGCRIFCLDTANGANILVKRAINNLSKYKDSFLIVGNVASKECFKWLSELGIYGIRVGIAGGGVCSTKTETGIYYPMASLLNSISETKEKYKLNTIIMADGGIKIPADMCKALGLGANLIMLGSLLAGCKESPAQVLKIDNKLYKVLRGAASFSVQKEFGVNPTYVEGMETLVEYSGHVYNILKRFENGLRSSMSYLNAPDLETFRKNVDFIKIT